MNHTCDHLPILPTYSTYLFYLPILPTYSTYLLSRWTIHISSHSLGSTRRLSSRVHWSSRIHQNVFWKTLIHFLVMNRLVLDIRLLVVVLDPTFVEKVLSSPSAGGCPWSNLCREGFILHSFLVVDMLVVLPEGLLWSSRVHQDIFSSCWVHWSSRVHQNVLCVRPSTLVGVSSLRSAGPLRHVRSDGHPSGYWSVPTLLILLLVNCWLLPATEALLKACYIRLNFILSWFSSKSATHATGMP